jgi:hypothetical protein
VHGPTHRLKLAAQNLSFAAPHAMMGWTHCGHRMAKILSFKKPSPKAKNQGKTLCLHDFHKWAVVSERKFDVRQGKLVTLYRCQRCGKEKTELS